ncbi:hypothetical protein A2392_02655 [Candidatus Kaiserbacteria bacterium RIFOXYB1_FULL_46_14]|uniref:Elongation factor P C-terminal domain-containing protein n=1 Tax=Candidatus Kaiserbacteria bacterium RIFOXYB1_FULL_46_14 TaxID=1798531 RepID=A0A1F6FIF7_9BACT|nr:MAG: hypothetical protein A2392_02655 [Candidatus Kaiserbacteria bacterium RIFOXYB1_FULL_46_14]
MSVLSYNEILPKKVILWNDEPYLVVSSHVFRKQQRKPVNVTKLKSLKGGRVVENSFHQNETVEEAELEKKTITFIYESKGEYWFHDTKDKSQRFALAPDTIGSGAKFMKANSEVEALVFDEEIIGVTIPIKVELKVKEAMPAVKGNTSSGALKEVTLETGATLMVPMFIGEGDIISINTETATYSERMEKA